MAALLLPKLIKRLIFESFEGELDTTNVGFQFKQIAQLNLIQSERRNSQLTLKFVCS
jgi:hypothetical protein